LARGTRSIFHRAAFPISAFLPSPLQSPEHLKLKA
jgi:hypothetical protein